MITKISSRTLFALATAMFIGCGGPLVDTCETDAGDLVFTGTYTCSADGLSYQYCNDSKEIEVTDCPEGSTCMGMGDEAECQDENGQPVESSHDSTMTRDGRGTPTAAVLRARHTSDRVPTRSS